jgi:hypothetical protein
MDESTVVAFVEKNAERMMREFGLPHWRIRWKASVLAPDVRGEVTIDASREQAYIEVDPAQTPDEDSLVKTIEHELIHCAVAPFDAFMEFAREWIPEGPARESARKVWVEAMERAVRNVERMAWGLRHAVGKTAGVGTIADDIPNNGDPKPDLISRHPHT